MRISARIKVMNNGSENPGCGLDQVLVGTNTGCSIDILIPPEAMEKSGPSGVVIELNREELTEFLARTTEAVKFEFNTPKEKA